MGKLYVVGTPIGNLGDISPRALEVLGQVDFIAAEDTRVSLKLLNHFGIKKPLVSYYEHNIREKSDWLVERMLGGEDCAIITDAGMPCISDPGEILVDLCHRRGVEVVVVPGPSAVIAALAASGLATSRFTFEGFLTVNKSGRQRHLEEVKNDPRTLIFYEAPHKLITTLGEMLRVLGDRPLVLCRELTKYYEEVRRTTLAEAVDYYRERAPKGEFVLVLAGAPKAEEDPLTLEEAAQLVRARIAGGESPTQAAKEVAKETGHKKGELYKAALEAE